MLKLRVWPILALLLICLPRLAHCQFAAEVAWQVRHNAGAKATFVAGDNFGNLYVIEQLSSLKAQLNIFDPFGAPVKTYSFNGVVTGLVVNPASGTATVSIGNFVQTLYWDGYGWDLQFLGTPLERGMDDSGKVIMLNQESSSTQLDTFSGDGIDRDTSIPVVADSSYIDGSGRFLLIGGSGTLESSTSFANFYSPDGTLLWTRTFSRSFTIGDTIGGFVEGQDGIGYLVVNHVSAEEDSNTYIEAIDPNKGASDLFDTAAISGGTTLVAADDTQIYIAGFNGVTPFIAAYYNSFGSGTEGTQVWIVNQPATQMIGTEFGIAVLSYDSASTKGTIARYDGDTGAALNTWPLTIPTSADLGTIAYLYNGGIAYVGDIGGASSTSFMAEFVYGPCLSSLGVPKSVVGGSSAGFSVIFDQAATPSTPDVTLSSSNPKALDPPAYIVANGVTTTGTAATSPVDADTVVTLTGEQSFAGVRRSASFTVLSAKIGAFQINLPTLTAPVTANGQITLTGPAGPSGKTITLSSNSPTLAVPASFKIPANSSTGTFTIVSHPVSKDNTVTISATLNGQTFTSKVIVRAPVLSSFLLNPSSVVGGTNSAGSVGLTGPVAAAETVTVSCASPNVTVPATVTIAAGASSVSIPIKTKAVTAPTTAVIKVTFGALSQSQTLTITK